MESQQQQSEQKESTATPHASNGVGFPAQYQGPVQRKAAPNTSPLPTDLKANLESTFNTNIDHLDFRVNSSFPAKVGAIATAQKDRIDIAPGHFNPTTTAGKQLIGHEVWHTVQQAQGRVKPTMQMKSGHAINDDKHLEAEADRMGARAAASSGSMTAATPVQRAVGRTSGSSPIQRVIGFHGHDRFVEEKATGVRFVARRSETGHYDLYPVGSLYTDTPVMTGIGTHDDRFDLLPLRTAREMPRADALGQTSLPDYVKGVGKLMEHRALPQEQLERVARQGASAFGSPKDEAFSKAAHEQLEPVPRGLVGNRFKHDSGLREVAQGATQLRAGDSGKKVFILQRALQDLDRLNSAEVTGTFDAATARALRMFQSDCGILATGVLDDYTLLELDKVFATSRPYVARLQRVLAEPATEGQFYSEATAPEELLVGTTDVDERQSSAARSVIRTAPPGRKKGGSKEAKVREEVSDFTPEISGKGTYEECLMDVVRQVIEAQFRTIALGNKRARGRSGGSVEWDHLHNLAVVAKSLTDSLFGAYARNLPFTPNVNLFDWQDYFTKLKEEDQRPLVISRIKRIINQSEQARQLDAEFNATSTGDREMASRKSVLGRVLKDKRLFHRMVQVTGEWSGYHSAGRVFVQRLFPRSGDPLASRKQLWSILGTMVHEYIHGLEHPECHKQKQMLKPNDGALTIGEGFVEFFTRVVMSGMPLNDQLRREVEGGLFDPDVPIEPAVRTGYSVEVAATERVASIIGFQNLCAVFFLGRLDSLRQAKPVDKETTAAIPKKAGARFEEKRDTGDEELKTETATPGMLITLFSINEGGPEFVERFVNNTISEHDLVVLDDRLFAIDRIVPHPSNRYRSTVTMRELPRSLK